MTPVSTCCSSATSRSGISQSCSIECAVAADRDRVTIPRVRPRRRDDHPDAHGWPDHLCGQLAAPPRRAGCASAPSCSPTRPRSRPSPVGAHDDLRLPPGPSRRKLIGLASSAPPSRCCSPARRSSSTDQISFRATKVENVTAVAAIVGHNAAAALAFDDALSGAKILDGLRAKPSITRAWLYRRDGTIFATYSRPTSTSHLHRQWFNRKWCSAPDG